MKNFRASNVVLTLLCRMVYFTDLDRVNVCHAASGFGMEFHFSRTEIGLAFSAFAYLRLPLPGVPDRWVGQRLLRRPAHPGPAGGCARVDLRRVSRTSRPAPARRFATGRGVQSIRSPRWAFKCQANASSSRWGVPATIEPCEVRLPRAIARPTSLRSGFAGLVRISCRPMCARIRIPHR